MGAKLRLLLAPSNPCRLGTEGDAQPRTTPAIRKLTEEESATSS